MIETKDEIECFFNITYTDVLEFQDNKVLEKVQKKSLKKLSRNKHRLVNSFALELFEDDLIDKKSPPYYIKKVNPLVGYGVFAKKSIPELALIGEYTGIVRKRKFFEDRSNDYIFGYVIGPHDTPWVIDAKEKGNFTRFINHSYTPNLTSKWLIADGIGHIIFFANRFISKDEQLTYDYGPHYWKRRSYPQSF